MRKLLILILIVTPIFLLVKFVGIKAVEKHYKNKSITNRINIILRGIQLNESGNGTVGDEQAAICQWYAGTPVLSDMAQLGKAADAFDKWRVSAGFHTYIKEYSVVDVQPDPAEANKGGKPTVYIAAVNIDGREMYMRVPDEDAISWTHKPSDVQFAQPQPGAGGGKSQPGSTATSVSSPPVYEKPMPSEKVMEDFYRDNPHLKKDKKKPAKKADDSDEVMDKFYKDNPHLKKKSDKEKGGH